MLLLFLSDVHTAEFARRKGSRDRKKRMPRRIILVGPKPPKTYGEGIRRDAGSGARLGGLIGGVTSAGALGTLGAMNGGWKGALAGTVAGGALGAASGALQGGAIGAGVGAVRHNYLRKRRR